MKLTDAIKQALEKKKTGHKVTGEPAMPDDTKGPGPKPGAPVMNKPTQKKASGRGR